MFRDVISSRPLFGVPLLIMRSGEKGYRLEGVGDKQTPKTALRRVLHDSVLRPSSKRGIGKRGSGAKKEVKSLIGPGFFADNPLTANALFETSDFDLHRGKG